VAEELNQLMLEGCRVFHDVPIGAVWKHRSRARRANRHLRWSKPKRAVKRRRQGKRDYEVVFDGKRLQFPGATDSRSLDQATQQADRLRAFFERRRGRVREGPSNPDSSRLVRYESRKG